MFKRCKNNSFASRKDKPESYICYRIVICHALFEYNKYNNEDTKTVFNEFCTSFFENKIFKKANFLELYKVPMDSEENGYLLIDKTKGCFPLVFFSYSKSELAATRVEALENAIKDLKENIDKIITEFSNYKNKEWDDDLQEKLQSHFNYAEE